MNILIIGPSIERSKGGTATVIYEHLRNPIITGANKFKYLESHVDSNFAVKAFYTIRCLVHIFLHHRIYSIIHLHANSDISFYRKSVLLRFSKWFNKKTIIHIHGHDFDSFYKRNTPFLKKYIKGSLAKSNKILVLSEYWKRFFGQEFADLPSEILYNGIDVSSYASCIKEPTTFTKYLFMGRLGERKGVYDLIKAIDILVNSYNRKELKFYFAGDGDLDNVKRIVISSNLADNVEVFGWLNNIEKRELLKTVDAIVLPSYEENLPMALIEGMACGKIIISTHAGGIPDLVEHGFNGYLHEAGNIEELIKCILFVNEHPATMIPISRNNINTIRDRFNLDTIAVRLNTIYNSV